MVSAVLAFITFLNYRLNKTLNIKNQLHNEKVKLYRDLIKAILDIIAMMDKGNRIIITDFPTEYLTKIEKVDDKIRKMAESLIAAFRKDLGTSKLNYKLGRN